MPKVEFRARLVFRPELVLGCVVSKLEKRVSKARGRPYIIVHFEGFSFTAMWNEHRAQRLSGVLEAGDRVHVSRTLEKIPDDASDEPRYVVRNDIIGWDWGEAQNCPLRN